MSYLTNFISSSISSGKTYVKSQMNKEALATLLGQLKPYQCIKERMAAYQDSLCQTLLEAYGTTELPKSSLIPRKFLLDTFSEVDSQTARIIVEAIQAISDNEKFVSNKTQQAGVTVSSTAGRCYNLIVSEVNGKKEIVTSYLHPDVSDYFLKFQNGKYYLSQYIKSIDYFNPDDPVTISSVYEGTIALLDAYDVSDEGNSIDSNLTNVCNHLNINVGLTTIDSKIRAIATYENVEYTDDFNTLQAIYAKLSTGFSCAGVTSYIGEIINGLAVKSTMDSIIAAAISLIVKGRFTIENFKSIIANFLTNACTAVAKLINGICSAFATGGFYGVISYIYSVIKGEGSVENNDGVLSFTDNNSLVPAQYIAGMATKICSTVISVVSTMISVVSPIIAVVGGLVGSVIGAIPLAVNYDYTKNAHAGRLSDEKFLLEATPLAYLQVEIDINPNNSVWKYVLQLIDENASIVYCEVPGGFLLLGRTDQSIDNKIRVEFHPSTDYVKYSRFSERVQNGQTIYLYGKTITAQSIETRWTEHYTQCYNDNSGSVSEGWDIQLRRNVCSNYAAFLLWLYCSTKGPIQVSGNDFLIKQILTNAEQSSAYFGLITATHGTSDAYALLCCNYATLWEDDNYGHVNVNSPLPKEWEWLATDATDYQITNNTVNFSFKKHNETPTTANISSWTDVTYSFSLDVALRKVIQQRLWLDDLSTLPTTYNYAYQLPKYDRATFLMWVIIATTIVAAVAAVTAITALGVKKWRLKQRAKLNAKAGNAWEKYNQALKPYDSSDPDDRPEYHTKEAQSAAYKNYKSAVFKNNIMSGLVGGTKLSMAGYWESEDGEAVTSASEQGESYVSTLLTSVYNPVADQMDMPSERVNDTFVNEALIFRTITGYDPYVEEE